MCHYLVHFLTSLHLRFLIYRMEVKMYISCAVVRVNKKIYIHGFNIRPGKSTDWKYGSFHYSPYFRYHTFFCQSYPCFLHAHQNWGCLRCLCLLLILFLLDIFLLLVLSWVHYLRSLCPPTTKTSPIQTFFIYFAKSCHL